MGFHLIKWAKNKSENSTSCKCEKVSLKASVCSSLTWRLSRGVFFSQNHSQQLEQKLQNPALLISCHQWGIISPVHSPPPPTSLRKSMQIIEMTHKVFEVIGFALLSGTKNKCSVFTLWITSCALIVCACLLDLAVLRNQSLGQCARMCPYMISGPMTSGDWPLDSSLGLLGRRDQGLKVLQDNANKVADGFVWDRTHV